MRPETKKQNTSYLNNTLCIILIIIYNADFHTSIHLTVLQMSSRLHLQVTDFFVITVKFTISIL